MWSLKMLNGKVLFPVFIPKISRYSVRGKAYDLKKSGLKIQEDVVVPVETNTEKLANYVCGTNLFIEGGEDIKLKEDSEYPDWLWKIHSPLPLEELSPNTKTYWNKVRKIREREHKYLLSLQKHKTVHK